MTGYVVRIFSSFIDFRRLSTRSSSIFKMKSANLWAVFFPMLGSLLNSSIATAKGSAICNFTFPGCSFQAEPSLLLL